MELCCTGWPDYELVDSGDGLRLERIGEVVISRQAAQAVWPRTLSQAEWTSRVVASHYRTDQGPGSWTVTGVVPEPWRVQLGDLTMQVRLAPFGHVGFFADQQEHWRWIGEQLSTRPSAQVLNLFGYTGGATLTAARAGGEVTHVDAAKSIVNGARRNAESSGLADAPIRWLVEDAVRFVERALRRGTKYDAVIIDPPTFGRGPKGRVWKIERDLEPLVVALTECLSDAPLFVLLTGHTPGYTAAVLRNMLAPMVHVHGGTLQHGDMVQTSSASPHLLPGGSYCRWTG